MSLKSRPQSFVRLLLSVSSLTCSDLLQVTKAIQSTAEYARNSKSHVGFGKLVFYQNVWHVPNVTCPKAVLTLLFRIYLRKIRVCLLCATMIIIWDSEHSAQKGLEVKRWVETASEVGSRRGFIQRSYVCRTALHSSRSVILFLPTWVRFFFAFKCWKFSSTSHSTPACKFFFETIITEI